MYHFHTRTKTGRARQLQDAAPELWVEVSAADAALLGLTEGDLAEIESPRGSVRARVRVTGIREGVVFLPFHYGYWDRGGHGPEPDGGGRAANELTITEWDPPVEAAGLQDRRGPGEPRGRWGGSAVGRPDDGGVRTGDRRGAADPRGPGRRRRRGAPAARRRTMRPRHGSWTGGMR